MECGDTEMGHGCPTVFKEQNSVPLLSLGDGTSDCCMDQSRLQLDPGSVFF